MVFWVEGKKEKEITRFLKENKSFLAPRLKFNDGLITAIVKGRKLIMRILKIAFW